MSILRAPVHPIGPSAVAGGPYVQLNDTGLRSVYVLENGTWVPKERGLQKRVAEQLVYQLQRQGIDARVME